MSTREGVAYYSATAGQNWARLAVGGGGFGGFEAVVASAAGSAWTVGFQGAIRFFAGPPPQPGNRPPEPAFTFAANRLTVAFTDASTDPDGTVESYLWEFDAFGGEGATSTERNPTHTFAAAGTYIVRLTVTDDDGATGSTGAAVVVSPGPGGTFGGFTEVTPFAQPFVTPQDEDFWVATTAAADYRRLTATSTLPCSASTSSTTRAWRSAGPAPQRRRGGGRRVGLHDRRRGPRRPLVGRVGHRVGRRRRRWRRRPRGRRPTARRSCYRNDAGTLVRTATVLPGYYEDNDQGDFDLRSITWADIDNDGDLDLLIPSALRPGRVRVSHGPPAQRRPGRRRAAGRSPSSRPASRPTRHAQSAWADSDGDGDLDLLLVNVAPLNGEGFIRHYRNDGAGTFTGETLLDGLTVEHGEAQWGDLDADGDLDLLVAGNIGETDGTFTLAALRVYRNDGGPGAGAYTRTDVLPCPACEGWFDLTAATWADYDSDGDMDILVTGSYNPGSQIEGRARILLNDGGTFTDAGVTLPAPRGGGTRGGTFSWLDLDGDLDLDYFIAGEYFVPGGNGLIEAQMHAYLNDAEGANTVPTAPRSLTATAAGPGRVALAWAAASDDSTPAGALTYDLALRRVGGPAAPAGRLPEPGNLCGHDRVDARRPRRRHLHVDAPRRRQRPQRRARRLGHVHRRPRRRRGRGGARVRARRAGTEPGRGRDARPRDPARSDARRPSRLRRARAPRGDARRRGPPGRRPRRPVGHVGPGSRHLRRPADDGRRSRPCAA